MIAVTMEEQKLPISDMRRQQMRDDRLWKREQQRAVFYNLKRIRCPCAKCKRRVECSLAKVKEHLIQHGKEPIFRIWRGPGDRDSSNEEWEQEFKTPRQTHENGVMDAGFEVRTMVEDAFQGEDEQRQPLEDTLHEIVMDAFHVVDGLDQFETLSSFNI